MQISSLATSTFDKDEEWTRALHMSGASVNVDGNGDDTLLWARAFYSTNGILCSSNITVGFHIPHIVCCTIEMGEKILFSFFRVFPKQGKRTRELTHLVRTPRARPTRVVRTRPIRSRLAQ